jgi:hypothetical protein
MNDIQYYKDNMAPILGKDFILEKHLISFWAGTRPLVEEPKEIIAANLKKAGFI